MIWCVEDDASIRDIEVYDLQSTGFEAKGFEDGTSIGEALFLCCFDFLKFKKEFNSVEEIYAWSNGNFKQR